MTQKKHKVQKSCVHNSTFYVDESPLWIHHLTGARFCTLPQHTIPGLVFAHYHNTRHRDSFFAHYHNTRYRDSFLHITTTHDTEIRFCTLPQHTILQKNTKSKSHMFILPYKVWMKVLCESTIWLGRTLPIVTMYKILSSRIKSLIFTRNDCPRKAGQWKTHVQVFSWDPTFLQGSDSIWFRNV